MRRVHDRPGRADAWLRALTIATRVDNIDFQLRAQWALWVERMHEATPWQALEHAERFGELSLRSADPMDRLIAERMRARSCNFIGDQSEAETLIRGMLAAYSTPPDASDVSRYQYDQFITARVTLVRVLWLRGKVDEAIEELDDMVEMAIAADHNLTLCHTLSDAACPIALMANDRDRAEFYVNMLLEKTTEGALDVWHAYAECYRGELLIRAGSAADGIAVVRRASDRLANAGFNLYRTVFDAAKARGLHALGRSSRALDILDTAVGRCRSSGEAWFLPQLQRMKAGILVEEGDAASAAAVLEDGLALARRQHADQWAALIEADLQPLTVNKT